MATLTHRELVRLKFSFFGGMCTGKIVEGLITRKIGLLYKSSVLWLCVLSVKIRIESRAGFTV